MSQAKKKTLTTLDSPSDPDVTNLNDIRISSSEFEQLQSIAAERKRILHPHMWHKYIALAIYVGVLTVDTFTTLLYVMSPGPKARTWSLFWGNFVALQFARDAFGLDSGILQFRRVMCYTFLVIAAVIPVAMSYWTLLDVRAGKRSWFEAGYGFNGLVVKYCERVGPNKEIVMVGEECDISCWPTEFLHSKMLLFLMILTVMIVRVFVIWIPYRRWKSDNK
ncbi:hypothetical protein BGZ93_006533 [Podila epicladia]|nr:hypothetical protein BGZ92_006350 [Podila epicladia]KAG0094936.1 hypothetical protein BGZ93_006533 [Podila epicladia]